MCPCAYHVFVVSSEHKHFKLKNIKRAKFCVYHMVVVKIAFPGFRKRKEKELGKDDPKMRPEISISKMSQTTSLHVRFRVY